MNLNQRLSPMRAARALNEQLLCSVRPPKYRECCPNHRHELYGWCKEHAAAAKAYLSPIARNIRVAEYEAERAMVRPIIAANASTHPLARQAIQDVQSLLARAVDSDTSYSGAEEMLRLAQAGITAQAIVVEALAVMLFFHRRPHYEGWDDSGVDGAIALAITRMAPRHRRYRSKIGTFSADRKKQFSYAPRPRTASLRWLGQFFRQSLSRFSAAIDAAMKARGEAARAREAALAAPLAMPDDEPAATSRC
jgi:hypothetical protein